MSLSSMGGYVCLLHGGSQNTFKIFYISSCGRKKIQQCKSTHYKLFSWIANLKYDRDPSSPWIMALVPFSLLCE